MLTLPRAAASRCRWRRYPQHPIARLRTRNARRRPSTARVGRCSHTHTHLLPHHHHHSTVYVYTYIYAFAHSLSLLSFSFSRARTREREYKLSRAERAPPRAPRRCSERHTTSWHIHNTHTRACIHERESRQDREKIKSVRERRGSCPESEV